MSSSAFRDEIRRIRSEPIAAEQQYKPPMEEEHKTQKTSPFQDSIRQIREQPTSREESNQPESGGFWSELKKFVTSPELNAWEQGLQRAGGIAGRGLSKAAGTPADLGLLATYLGQQTLRGDFPEVANAPAPEFLQDYSSEALAHAYDQLTGGDYVPEGLLENLIEKGTEFGASGPFFEGKAALKGGNALRNIMAGLGSGAAEQSGAGGIGQAVGALSGGISPDVIKLLRPKNLKTSIAKGLGEHAGGTVDRGVRKAVLEEGLTTTPASIQTGSKLIKGTEKFITQNPLSGTKFEDSLSSLNTQVAENFVKKVGKGVQDTYENAIKSSQNAQDFLNNIYKTTEKYFGSAYEGVKQKAKDWKISPKHYEETLNDLETSLKKTLAESPEKSSVLDDIKNMKANLYDEHGRPKKFGLEELINTRTDLNSVYNRVKEFKGAQKFRKTFPKAIAKDLEELKKTHPDVYRELKDLDKKFGSHRESFNNKVIKAIRNEERPEVIIGLMRQPSDFDKVSKILNKTPNGRRVLDSVKQAKLQQVFSEQFLNAKNGVFDYGKYKSLLDTPQVNKWIDKLASPEQVRAIKNLEKISSGFQSGAKYLQKTPEYVSKIKGAGDIALIGSALSSLVVGNPAAAFVSGLGLAAPKILASIYSDPEMIKIMLNTAKAGNSKNTKSYVNGIKKIGQRILQSAEVSPEQEESMKSGLRDQESPMPK